MAAAFEVILSADLDALASDWSEGDKEKLLALIELLEEFGFDLIINYLDKQVDWFAPEFAEPGEIPDMLWARVFVDMEASTIVLRITMVDGVLKVDSG